MSDQTAVFIKILLIAGPIVMALGCLVAVWSIARTRRRYYEEFMRNRKK